MVSQLIDEDKGAKLVALEKAVEEFHEHGYEFGALRDDNIILHARGWPY